MELLLDLFSHLRALLNAPAALSESAALQCVHALLQLLSGHGAALAVDAKDVQLRLYGLLAQRSLMEDPHMLATALDCVEHLCRKDRTSLLAPRAASMVRRLLSLALACPHGHAIALLCAVSRLLVACPRIGTMLEPPEGGVPDLAMRGVIAPDGGEGGYVAAIADGADIDSAAAINSTAWQLVALRRHYHPMVCELAEKVAAREPLPPRFLSATPLSLMSRYSDAGGAFNPTPTPPKPHRLAKLLEAARARGAEDDDPKLVLANVPSSSLESVREAEALASAAAGESLATLHFIRSKYERRVRR